LENKTGWRSKFNNSSQQKAAPNFGAVNFFSKIAEHRFDIYNKNKVY